jgi:hypothetical protein
MLSSLNKEVNFLGEPMRVWEIPMSCILIFLVVIIGSAIFMMTILASILLWIIFPPFRRWIDDSVEDMMG